MSRTTGLSLGALLLAATLAGCGDEQPERTDAFVRTEVDVAARLGAPADGALAPGTVLAGELGLPARAWLAVEASGPAGARLDVALRQEGREVLATTLDLGAPGPHEVDLSGESRRRVELALAVPADGPAVDLAGVHVRVTDRPPDIVLIVVDTLRADLFITRRDLVDTPHIDALTRESVPFTRAFSHAPMTLPSHTALFSSRYPFESGVLNNGQPVPEDVPLLAEHLRDQGYQTRAVVSLGTLWPRLDRKGTTLDRGFDTYVPTPGHVTPAPVVREAISAALEDVDPVQPLFLFAHFCDPHEPYNVHGQRADGLPPFEADVRLDGETLDRITTSDATHWVRELELAPGPHRFEVLSDRKVNVRLLRLTDGGRKVDARLTDGGEGEEYKSLRGKALFNPVAEFDVPGSAPRTIGIEAWVTDHPMGRNVPYRYFREVDFVDRYVGELVRELKARGLFDHSAVVFTSDHGEALREHNFTGHVQNLFDEMTHVPLLIKPPLGHPAAESLRRLSREVVRHVDVVPTLLEIAALPPLKGQRGLSLLRDGDRPVISETHRPEATESQIAMRDATHKLIYYIDRDAFELYDLERDPFELRDVFAEEGDRFRAWQANLRTMAELSKSSGVDLEDLSDEERRRMEALGYFGDE